MPPASQTGPSDDAALSRATRIRRSREQASADLVDDTVIMSMRDGTYYGLEAVGSRVWALVAEPVALGEVLDRIVAEFDVEGDQAWTDLRALVAELLERGLVDLVDATT